MTGNNIILEQIAMIAMNSERARIIEIIKSMPYEKRDDWELISRTHVAGRD